MHTQGSTHGGRQQAHAAVRSVPLLARVVATLLAPLMLVACGGGSGLDPAPTPATAPANVVPGSAVASIASFIGYLGQLGANDSTDALGIDAITPPVSETDEPSPVS
jgi:hypothetical protein